MPANAARQSVGGTPTTERTIASGSGSAMALATSRAGERSVTTTGVIATIVRNRQWILDPVCRYVCLLSVCVPAQSDESGCPLTCGEGWRGDGECDAPCNVEQCGFDDGDCEGVTTPPPQETEEREAQNGEL
mmetsp:Transcript_26805/g.76921  ORF Transcript_26805/g.76921 Transcript_26805/m.76921 type:complete len:132 (-) Transcript_26805:348-743(-)